MDMTVFEPWLARWGLTPDGAPFSGTFSRLLPVLRGAEPAMLKASMVPEEVGASRLMDWYQGVAAARVLAQADDALLLERVTGGRSLAGMARAGNDDAALDVLCGVAAKLHAPRRAMPPDTLVPLSERVAPLRLAAKRHRGILGRCWEEALTLLAAKREERPLHGDLWHDNVLDGGARGWLAIDPKGLLGEREYDYALMLVTPDFEEMTDQPRLRRRLTFVSRATGLEAHRLLRWVLVQAGLYAVWSLEGGHSPGIGLSLAEIAAAELGAR